MWVKDGAEALDFLFARGEYAHRGRAVRPRVVLLDLRLPKVDGIEVLRQIRSDDRLRTLPVVILTSSNEDADVAAAWANGVNSYVAKPVRFPDFEKVASDLGMYWLILKSDTRLVTAGGGSGRRLSARAAGAPGFSAPADKAGRTASGGAGQRQPPERSGLVSCRGAGLRRHSR